MTVLQLFTTARSGSIDTTVHSHNQYGPYTRNRTTPTNPNTALQQTARRAWGQAGFRWHSVLTADQRQLWRDYAVALWKFSPRPKRRFHTGQQLHQRLNACRRNDRTLGWLDAPPTELRSPVWTRPVCFDFGTSNLVYVQINTADSWVHEDMAALVVAVGDRRPATVHFYKHPWRLCTVIRGSSTAPPTAVTPFTDPWGSGSNANRWLRAYLIAADGRCATPYAAPFADNS